MNKPWWLQFGASPGISTNQLSGPAETGIRPVSPRPFFVLGQQIGASPVYTFNGQYRVGGPNVMFPGGPSPVENYNASSQFWNAIKQKGIQSTLAGLL